MDEADAGEELRVSCNAFFEAKHANEHHAKSIFIEDRPQLFKAVHRQAICFIDNDQAGGVWNCFDSGFVLAKDLEVGRASVAAVDLVCSRDHRDAQLARFRRDFAVHRALPFVQRESLVARRWKERRGPG